MASIFSRIVAGEIPCYKVAEDDNYFAFLDISPVAPGHTLVIPKKEVDYIFDLTDEEYLGLMTFARKVAAALQKSMPCKRIGVAVRQRRIGVLEVEDKNVEPAFGAQL